MTMLHDQKYVHYVATTCTHYYVAIQILSQERALFTTQKTECSNGLKPDTKQVCVSAITITQQLECLKGQSRWWV